MRVLSKAGGAWPPAPSQVPAGSASGRPEPLFTARLEVGTYRIVDWETNFENNQTRVLKHMVWVKMPTKQDGAGYSELMDHPDGAAHFGAWCAIVQIAAKCSPRGTLVRSGGRPHNCESLERACRIPSPILRAAIDRLIAIGWLEVAPEGHRVDAAAELRPNRGDTAAELLANRREEKRGDLGEEKTHTARASQGEDAGAPDLAAYQAVMERHYPRFPSDTPLVSRALLEFRRELPPLEEFETALLALAGSQDWQDDGGRFVPRPERWLRREGWKEVPRRPGAPVATDVDPLSAERRRARSLIEAVAEGSGRPLDTFAEVLQGLEACSTVEDLAHRRDSWIASNRQLIDASGVWR